MIHTALLYKLIHSMQDHKKIFFLSWCHVCPNTIDPLLLKKDVRLHLCFGVFMFVFLLLKAASSNLLRGSVNDLDICGSFQNLYILYEVFLLDYIEEYTSWIYANSCNIHIYIGLVYG